MKIIFIDVDGPLIPGRALYLPKNKSAKEWPWQFDPCAVSMINFMTFAFKDLHAVIASHRVGIKSPYPGMSTDTLEFWEKLFKQNGLNVRFHKQWITPRKGTRRKVYEIGDWLDAHPDIDNFVTIEDEINGHYAVTGSVRERFNLYAEDYNDGITYANFMGMCNQLGLTHGMVFHKYNEFLADQGSPTP